MAVIRPLERDDLEQVARVVVSGIPSWRRDPAVLARSLIDHPWTGDRPRSLVAVDANGVVIGSIGAQRRRVRFDDRELEAVCVSHLVVDPAKRGGAAGALLVRALLAGDQDFTFSDSATADVVRIWRTFGGDLDTSRSCDFMLVLRPGRWLGNVAALTWSRRRAIRRETVPVPAIPLQAGGRRLLARAFPATDPGVTSSEVSIASLAASLPSIVAGVRLRVDYDERYLEWVFDYLAALAGADPIVRRLVSRGERPIGWYAYLRRPTASRVLHIGASPREAPAVVSALVDDARSAGTAVLTGRLEPHIQQALSEHYPAIGLAHHPLIHCRDPELRAALGSSAAIVTEMDLIDSAWW